MSLITRDLLGNHRSSKQLQFPDFKTEHDYLGRCRPTNTPRPIDHAVSKPQDLMNQTALNLFDDTNLDLKLVSFPPPPSSSSSSSSSSPPYTLGKVKFALERAEKEHTKKRPISTSNSSIYEKKFDDEAYAAGCPSCLLYVLISSRNPRCPRCNSTVPSPAPIKKPRLDLNITI